VIVLRPLAWCRRQNDTLPGRAVVIPPHNVDVSELMGLCAPAHTRRQGAGCGFTSRRLAHSVTSATACQAHREQTDSPSFENSRRRRAQAARTIEQQPRVSCGRIALTSFGRRAPPWLPPSGSERET
jgi:hypothetical protein